MLTRIPDSKAPKYCLVVRFTNKEVIVQIIYD